MGFALTVSDKITCSLQGSVQTSSSVKLQVNGNAVLVASSIEHQSVSNCPGVSASNVPPCTSVTSLTAGKSQKLQAGGEPVVLDNVNGGTAPPHATDMLTLLPGTQDKLQAS